jgi:hypothetical protein
MKVRYFGVTMVGVIAAFSQSTTTKYGSGPTKMSGVVHSTVEPAPWGSTLGDLTAKADLVVEGLVDASNFPARQPSPGIPSHIETDVVFLITRFLKGSLTAQSTFPRVVISEHGGTVGDLSVVTGEPPLRQGQRMILFLQADTRANLKTIAALPRYLVVGIWHGKFEVVNGRISVPAHSAPDLRNHHMEDHDSFVSKVVSAVGLKK